MGRCRKGRKLEGGEGECVADSTAPDGGREEEELGTFTSLLSK